jgi:hypothetical protein
LESQPHGQVFRPGLSYSSISTGGLIVLSDLISTPITIKIGDLEGWETRMAENALACIDSRMTVLDAVSRHRATEAVFKAWDDRAGVCICCQALFDPIWQVADRYGLNLDQLMAELNFAASHTDAP